jgi:Alpha/beta hydrolase of unknown function (DUF900)
MGTSFSRSYIFTTRSDVNATTPRTIIPLPSGKVGWYSAPGQYNGNVNDYSQLPSFSPSTQPPPPLFASLLRDAQIAVDNGCAQITLLIHGLGNLWPNVVSQLSLVGATLQTDANYGGLVVSFDWPSFNGDASVIPPNYGPDWAFPPTATAGSIRGNINGSVAAFLNVLETLRAIKQSFTNNGVSFGLNVVCHSEGNYMLMLGTQEASFATFDQIIMAAADINDAAIQQGNSLPPDVGEGIAIATAGLNVTIYHSFGDDVLAASEAELIARHNPAYPARLGFEGPSSHLWLPKNVVAVDCSAVVNAANFTGVNGWPPPGTSPHVSYFQIPQIIQDWANTLNGAPASSVPNRMANVHCAGVFTMRCLEQQPSAPRPRIAASARSI